MEKIEEKISQQLMGVKFPRGGNGRKPKTAVQRGGELTDAVCRRFGERGRFARKSLWGGERVPNCTSR